MALTLLPCSTCAGQELAPNGLSCSCEEHEVLVRWKGWPALISVGLGLL